MSGSTMSPSRAWPLLRPLTTTMTAVRFHDFGGPDVLQVDEVPVPSIAPNEVLVQVAAVSVGRLLDLVARSGRHPYATFSLPHILGAEHSGVIAAVGSEVIDIAPGQRIATFPALVCGRCAECTASYDELCPQIQLIGTHRAGAYAQYVAVPGTSVTVVPDDVDPVQACALALGAAVGMNQLSRAQLQPGDWVLIQGAASSLGSMTGVLARHLDANVIATSRDAAKRAELHDLGFEHVLDGTGPDFTDRISALTSGEGVHIAVDNIGDPILWRNSQAALRRGGTLVSSGAFRGQDVPVNLQRLYSMGQRIIGVRTGNRASVRRVWEEVARGLRPPTAHTFPLAEAAAAHRYVEEDRNVGRVTLIVDAENGRHGDPAPGSQGQSKRHTLR